jgi:hypothetical protein
MLPLSLHVMCGAKTEIISGNTLLEISMERPFVGFNRRKNNGISRARDWRVDAKLTHLIYFTPQAPISAIYGTQALTKSYIASSR